MRAHVTVSYPQLWSLVAHRMPFALAAALGPTAVTSDHALAWTGLLGHLGVCSFPVLSLPGTRYWAKTFVHPCVGPVAAQPSPIPPAQLVKGSPRLEPTQSFTFSNALWGVLRSRLGHV